MINTDTTLKPCLDCGAPCRVEVFGPNDAGLPKPVTMWVCSAQRLFGGACLSDAYLTEAAWNQRTNPTDCCAKTREECAKIADSPPRGTMRPLETDSPCQHQRRVIATAIRGAAE